ncbi:protein kinase [Nannocystis sp.]|uniref:protein kinase domain-containing protein n=1 Tax=Nannocystis sp. TaxID=1962667 RepID=UPI0025FBC1E7|nr:protein kinase [Nannocystis sp.]MBK7828611.1 protein kinase [Nannocystis sp.]
MDSTPTPSTPEPARGRKIIMTPLLKDMAIGAKLRADLQAAKDWPVYEELGRDMEGELIGARYLIVRRLAKGGMGDVFLAKDLTRKCPVAIKILRSRRPEAARRFRMEGIILSNLQHPGIVRAVDVGETPDGPPYMALEYLDGEPLSVRVARGPLPWRDVATFGIQIAGAVHELHAAGIIHRDLKPANIMLTTGATGLSAAKLIDLGLARVGAPFLDVQDALFTPDPPERHQTQLGHPIGTPGYLPPEAGQCPAEPRLDVYSLGATLYQLCTQLLPRDTDGRPIREVCPGSDAPDDLSRLLQAALAPDPSERLASVDHLQRGLEAILAAHPRAVGARQLFGGSYDRLEVLGVGASAVVFRASDRRLSREVAVKVLRDAEPSEDDAIRFRRAAKVLSALRHPNIPRILHFGTHDEQTFAVTELCPGSPASSFMRPDNYLRPDEVVAVGLQLAGALAAGHAAGVVYRDLHPGNVLIDRGDPTRAWIFDFDQAQVSAEFYAALTERWATPPEERTEPKRGKPLQRMDYAAPEVRGGAAFSAASDVYALGLLLYRLLTGRRPFPLSGGEPRPPRELCPACPLELERMLLTMLSPSPGNRPTLDVFQAALNEDLEDSDDATAEAERAPRTPPPAPATAEYATVATVTASTVTATAPDRRPRRVPAGGRSGSRGSHAWRSGARPCRDTSPIRRPCTSGALDGRGGPKLLRPRWSTPRVPWRWTTTPPRQRSARTRSATQPRGPCGVKW